jgi:hypothetical protein
MARGRNRANQNSEDCGGAREANGKRSGSVSLALYSRRGDRAWLLGCVLLFLAPSLILFTVGLLAVGSVWLGLWLVYLIFVSRYFPRVQTRK